LVSHLVITNPQGPMRLIYPVQAQIAQFKMTCSSGAPGWLETSLRYATRSQGSLANQIAYIDPAGQFHHCENGWSGTFWRSPEVDQNTRFRFASVTKLFTADAVLSLINAGKLTLNTRLVDILPEVLPVKDERLKLVTVEQLLNHTAGFDRSNGQDPMFLLDIKPWCPGRLQK